MSLVVDGYEWCELGYGPKHVWLQASVRPIEHCVRLRDRLRPWELWDGDRLTYHWTRRGAMRAYAKRRGSRRG